MPVVINEFEVVSEQQSPTQTPQSPAPAKAAEPPDVERLLAQRHARRERVRAY